MEQRRKRRRVTAKRPSDRTAVRSTMRQDGRTVERATERRQSRDERSLRRQRQRMAIVRRRRRWLALGLSVLTVLVVLLVLAWLGTFEKKAKTTTLTVMDDGRIQFEEVLTLDGETTGKEIKAFAREQIKAFNKAQRGHPVRLKQCQVRETTAYLKTVYKDMKSYAAFTGLDSFVGTIGEAREAGYAFDRTFVAVEDGKKGKIVDADTVTADEGKRVVIVDQALAVVLSQTPLYVSDAATTVEGRTVTVGDTVQTYIIGD